MKEQMKQASHWHAALEQELDKGYMSALLSFLEQEDRVNTVFPIESERLMALKVTPFDSVKVVILGQDPYHGEGQAHGLSFSVKPDVKIPPSLVNIYKELEADLAISPANHGSLIQWAEQGVLLLNSVLTVTEGKAGSHQKKGWETFTDRIIELINKEHEGVVFMLWGSYAQKKGCQIDKAKHCVLESVHPSPLSAYRGFFGCSHFSKANQYLISQSKAPINWSLDPIEKQASEHENHQIVLPL
ncbi:uracil-DNA glycosylase [Marinomonas sp. C2222]|uniref:Uracil-DNA glycosylase n=1 Tax=Marinomonas sargassi TaxID=2984494 RepID=A0ABT2YVL2_9GAMM|nr:uracil-DNA glycosylase [Marinomonas sargassi]MCV2403935.1 uracil-DNA glycosylase [Marinomonas sargassi]